MSYNFLMSENTQSSVEIKNHGFDAKSHLESQLYAINGVWLMIKNERNFRIQLGFAVVVCIVGLILGFSHTDWVAITLLIGLVLVSEAFNSVVEALCDTVSHEYRVNIRYAKDVSAGAVLISSAISVVAGTLIVLPYVTHFISDLIH